MAYIPAHLHTYYRRIAQALVIWDPDYNGSGTWRDYYRLVPWWWLRASVVEDYRSTAPPEGVLSVRLDYQRLSVVVGSGQRVTILCDLQSGVNRWTGGGAVVFAGSVEHKFNMWIPDARSEEMAPLITLIEKRYSRQDEKNYSGLGRGYAYVSGEVTKFNGKPQIELTDRNQLSDSPPKS